MPARRHFQDYRVSPTDPAAIWGGIALAAVVVGLVAFNQRSAPRLVPVVYIPQGAYSSTHSGTAPSMAAPQNSLIDLSFADTDLRSTIIR